MCCHRIGPKIEEVFERAATVQISLCIARISIPKVALNVGKHNGKVATDCNIFLIDRKSYP